MSQEEKTIENDHDLLIRIDEKLRMFMLEVGSIKKEVGNKIDRAELNDHMKHTGEAEKDHELRIRRIEKWGSMVAGGLVLAQIIFSKI